MYFGASSELMPISRLIIFVCYFFLLVGDRVCPFADEYIIIILLFIFFRFIRRMHLQMRSTIDACYSRGRNARAHTTESESNMCRMNVNEIVR